MARTRTGDPLVGGGVSGGRKLAVLNPYAVDANGWCAPPEPSGRTGPTNDLRDLADVDQRATLEDELVALRGTQTRRVDFEKLYRQWAEHPRRKEVAALFPAPKGRDRRAALRRELGRVRVRGARGDVVDIASKVKGCSSLTALEAHRVLEVLVDLRHAWKTRDADVGYDAINWRHACQEVGQILDVAEEHRMPPRLAEDAVLASLFSDAAKLKGNFLTHHIDGAVAAALVLPRFLDVATATGRERVVAICQAILEHQVGPPRFMAQMVRLGIEQHAAATGDALTGLDGLHAKIADPLNPRHVTLHEDGYGMLALDERERSLLSRVGLPAWYVPHPVTPWFLASSAVIDADSLVNYVTPDGVGKIVAICGPGTAFRDPTVFHSICSCGASFVDAVSVMSDTAMNAMREGVARTRASIDEVRARVLAEIEDGWLHFTPGAFRTIVEEEQVDTSQLTSTRRDGEILIDVPWKDGGQLPYWNASLDYTLWTARADDEQPDAPSAGQASYEFAKLLRRRVADLLREA